MFDLSLIAKGVWTELIRAITGQLFTRDQISQITSHAVGRYFSEFFPEPEREAKAKERVEEAKSHIIQANNIITEMQSDLENQSVQLDILLLDIEEKKKLAEKYGKLAATNEENFAALKEEMGGALREELVIQSEEGKTLRRISSAVIWLITLILGAALGAYFKEIVTWAKTLIA
ncbi:MAG: hypothetical protein N0E54_19135 [Candidatus Thiodiazotropha taylori]|nr:hypothetical protein [Candidatus Thiodiazotropha endolucinida]MCW4230863.1 hypothetical protein [Candidatus Thiodiazotropha taylori]